jgi:2-polyprenyl-3-methyl-5-hydroxy-6-metoxy-1,4-benzoquinol methylase
MKKRANRDLKRVYDRIFERGEKKHFSKNIEQKGALPVDTLEALAATSWNGKRVLDVGCGTGLFAYEAAKRGASVLAVDYSIAGINEAKRTHVHPNLEFRCEDIFSGNARREKFDVIVSLGTLEHMDEPLRALKVFRKMLTPKGSIVLTCPNWINPRGLILMTLKHLFDAPITLADIHYLSPHTFEQWSRILRMRLSWHTFNVERAVGSDSIRDLRTRIPNVLRDAKLPIRRGRVDVLLDWLEHDALTYPWQGSYLGATALYHLKRQQ